MFGWFKSGAAQLDLTKERGTFVSQIALAIAEVSRSPKAKVKKLITRVDIKFDLTSDAFPRVWVELDDEPSGEPDTGRLSRSQPLQIYERVCRHWVRPCHAAMDGKPTSVISPSGSTVVKTETSLCAAVGEFLVEIMKSMRKAGVFKSLPRAPKCYLGVSTNDGEFGWPSYEDRGVENMV